MIERFDFEELMEKEATKKSEVQKNEPKKGDAPADPSRRKFMKLFGLGVLAAALGGDALIGEHEKGTVRAQEREAISDRAEPVVKVKAKTEQKPIKVPNGEKFEESGVCEMQEAPIIEKKVDQDTPTEAKEEIFRELSAEEALKEMEENPEKFLQQYGFMAEYLAKNAPQECEDFYTYVVTKAKDFYEGHNERMVLVKKSFKNVAKYAPIIFEAAQEHQVPYGVALGMAILESKCRADLESKAGAKGILQLMPEAARTMGLRVDEKVDERENPRKNINAGLKYLKGLYKRFGRWDAAALAYNKGARGYRELFREILGKKPDEEITDEEVRNLGYSCGELYKEKVTKNYYSANAEAHLRMYLWYLQESQKEELAENPPKFKNPAFQ